MNKFTYKILLLFGLLFIGCNTKTQIVTVSRDFHIKNKQEIVTITCNGKVVIWMYPQYAHKLSKALENMANQLESRQNTINKIIVYP